MTDQKDPNADRSGDPGTTAFVFTDFKETKLIVDDVLIPFLKKDEED